MKSQGILKTYLTILSGLGLIFLLEVLFSNTLFRAGFLVSAIECAISLLSAFAVFGKVGSLSHKIKRSSFFLGLGFLALAFADFFWAYLYYLIKVDRKHWIAVVLTQVPYTFAYLSFFTALFSAIKKDRLVKEFGSLLWIPTLLITVPFLKYAVAPTFKAFLQEGPSIFICGHLFNMAGTFLLLNLSLVALLSSRDLFWSLIASGCAVLVVDNWAFRSELFAFGPPGFGFYDYLWAFGIATAGFPLLISSRLQEEIKELSFFERNSLVCQGRMWIISTVLVFLTLITFIDTSEFYLVRVISIGTISSILVAVFLSQFVAERIQRFALLLSLEVTDELGIGSLREKQSNLPLELRSIFQQVFEEKLKEKKMEEHLQKQISEIATQVAHDIRSPLAALQVVLPEMEKISEDSRILAVGAINRIKDICNQLMSRNRKLTQKNPFEIHLLSAHLESIVSQARAQYRNRPEVSIDFDFNKNNYGIFANIQAIELVRVVSNLINNGVEAIYGNGSILIELDATEENFARIRITDTGTGIAPEVLPYLMNRGASYGKENGNGLGLAHAKAFAETLGGKIEIQSEIGKGTSISLFLPLAPAPKWFISEIQKGAHRKIAVLDDDRSIHQLWAQRFEQSLFHFSSIGTFHQWFLEEESRDRILFLCDFELVGSSESGLDLIESLGLAGQSVLVTSRWEDTKIQSRCEQLGIKLLPKNCAPLIEVR